MTSKRCSKCYHIKPIHEFSRQQGGLYGRRANCKACQVAINKKYRQATRAMVIASVRQCHKCKAQLSPERALKERRRIQADTRRIGIGVRMATCMECWLKGLK